MQKHCGSFAGSHSILALRHSIGHLSPHFPTAGARIESYCTLRLLCVKDCSRVWFSHAGLREVNLKRLAACWAGVRGADLMYSTLTVVVVVVVCTSYVYRYICGTCSNACIKHCPAYQCHTRQEDQQWWHTTLLPQCARSHFGLDSSLIVDVDAGY